MAETRNALRLHSPNSTIKGKELCLHDGDLLIAVDGSPWTGSDAELRAKFASQRGVDHALTFQRLSKSLTVLTATSNLGAWEQVQVVGASDGVRLNPAVLRNWEIFVSKNNEYDVQPLAPSVLALIAPAIWLLQMRLWLPGAALLAAAMVSAAVSPMMLIAVYLTAGLHVWYAGPRYFRRDRKARGLEPRLVLAAPSERAAHAALLKFFPNARFQFAKAAPAIAAESPSNET